MQHMNSLIEPLFITKECPGVWLKLNCTPHLLGVNQRGKTVIHYRRCTKENKIDELVEKFLDHVNPIHR